MTDVTHEHHAAAVERESFSRRRYPFAVGLHRARDGLAALGEAFDKIAAHQAEPVGVAERLVFAIDRGDAVLEVDDRRQRGRSEEHTSELQSLMRISYAVFCLKKKHK